MPAGCGWVGRVFVGGSMRLTIQSGIDTHDLSQAIYDTIRAGMECDARAAQKRHEDRLALIRKSGGTAPAVAKGGQGSLFGEGE